MDYSSSSPVRLCDAQHITVRTDQTQHECASEHACPEGHDCPLAGSFAQITASYRVSRTWE